MMKKVVIILALVAMTGIASADIIFDGSTEVPTLGYMDVTAPEGNWGSPWALQDLRTFVTPSEVTLQTNVNGADDNPGDPYWNPPGHIGMRASSYTETYGLTGQTVTFNFEVLSNNLGGALDVNGNPIVTEAFIKVLDAGASWATWTGSVYESLTVGSHSISLMEASGYGNPVVQIGYHVIGANDISGSATADLSAVIVPEPATIALLGVGGFFLRRRKK